MNFRHKSWIHKDFTGRLYQWQFTQSGWQGWPSSLHRQPPLVSPSPWQVKKTGQNITENKIRDFYYLFYFLLSYKDNSGKKLFQLTSGPHRAPFVTQQISVWHIVHITQSQPSFFCTIMLQLGQCIASPRPSIVCKVFATMFWGTQNFQLAMFFNKFRCCNLYILLRYDV